MAGAAPAVVPGSARCGWLLYRCHGLHCNTPFSRSANYLLHGCFDAVQLPHCRVNPVVSRFPFLPGACGHVHQLCGLRLGVAMRQAVRFYLLRCGAVGFAGLGMLRACWAVRRGVRCFFHVLNCAPFRRAPQPPAAHTPPTIKGTPGGTPSRGRIRRRKIGSCGAVAGG